MVPVVYRLKLTFFFSGSQETMVRDRLKELRDAAGIDGEMVTITIDGGEEQKQLLDLLDKIGPLYSKLKVLTNSVLPVLASKVFPVSS